MMKNRERLVLIAILLVATWVRFHLLDGQSFWNDEGNSARLSERSLRLIIEGTASDVHPPLYYFILRGWRIFVGESEFALRSVSAFAGILTVALVVPLARFVGQRPESKGQNQTAYLLLLAPLFIALNPAHIYYSQEARMYTLLPFWVLLATVLLVAPQRRRRGSEIGYVVALVAGLYTHYFFPIAIAVHGLWMIRQKKSPLSGDTTINLQRHRSSSGHQALPFFRWVMLVAISIFLYLPWLPIMLGGLGGNRGAPQPVGRFLLGGWQFVLTGFAHSQFVWAGILAAVCLTLVVLGSMQVGRLALGLVLPFAALVVLGATDAEFYKFLLVVLPFVALLWAGGIGRIAQQSWIGHAATIFFLVLWQLSAESLISEQWHNEAYVRSDYRGLAERISAENHPDAAIILNAPNQWEVFTYYHTEGAPVYPLPLKNDRPATENELDAIRQTHERLYVLYWGDQQQDPEQWVQSWLEANTFQASSEWVGDVRFVTYAVPSAPAKLMEHVLGVSFAEGIRLNGYTLGSAETRRGDIVQLTAFWEATETIAARYKVFVHIAGADGVPVAQIDVEPSPMTVDWPPSEIFIGNYGVLIGQDVPAGTYNLTLGLYDAISGERLVSGSNDTIFISQLTVTE